MRGKAGESVTRRFQMLLNILFSRIGTVLGWGGFVFWLFIAGAAVFELPEAKDALDWGMPVLCGGMAAAHFLLIRRSKRSREMLQTFRMYSAYLAQNTSVAALAEAIGAPKEQVMKQVMEMCRRGYYNGHLDVGTERLVFDQSEGSVARCPGCGATTRIYRTGDKCRYCGNPLVKETEIPRR